MLCDMNLALSSSRSQAFQLAKHFHILVLFHICLRSEKVLISSIYREKLRPRDGAGFPRGHGAGERVMGRDG